MCDALNYAEQMSCLHHGYALFEPDPEGCGSDKIRIGDVGYVRDGAFFRLFNICASADDPINSFGVPVDFEPLRESFRRTHARTSLPAGLMSSKSVRKLGGNINVSASTQ